MASGRSIWAERDGSAAVGWESEKKRMRERRYVLALLGVLFAALLLKTTLLLADLVVFDSDEAVVGLMARHILEGERPVFFYGQAYMGSLDAWLIAGVFALLEPSVWAIRAVQVALFLAHVALTFCLAWRWSKDAATALASALLMALPPATLTLYTTISLGGYVETLVLGDLILLVGWKLASERKVGLRWWALFGVVVGLGFWTLGLSVVYLLPLGVLVLWRRRWLSWRGYLVAAMAFVIGSGPWWVYNLQHGWWAALELYDPFGQLDRLAPVLPMPERVLGMFLIGLPGLIGVRLPWSPEWFSVVVGPLVVVCYAGVALHALGEAKRHAWHGAYRLLWGMCLTFGGLFVLSRFGSDPTGRYFLPLYTPLTVFSSAAIIAMGRRVRWGMMLLVLLLAFNLWGTWRGASSGKKFTAQYDPRLQYGNDYDRELIAFLEEQGGERGYTNYWIAFKIAFLSEERVILAPLLPHKEGDRAIPSDTRYPPYTDLVSAADQVVYVTGGQPELDMSLRQGFAESEVSYRERSIGPYRVFYNLSAAAAPSELALR
jgi:4-amino-4-deoxy-L-arabinose transferase-like glycosyltransferase